MRSQSLLKGIALLLAICSVVGLAVAGVGQFSQTFTASTNSTLTAVGTLSSGGGSDYGTLRRMVITTTAGLTNCTFALVDKDGTTLLSTNIASDSLTNSATNVTWSAGPGVTPYVAPTVKTSGALVTTNTALSFTLTITREQ